MNRPGANRVRAGAERARRLGENTRPPRYLLLAAAARLPQRPPPEQRETFERSCPMCGRTVAFTHVHRAEGTEYLIEDHDCA